MKKIFIITILVFATSLKALAEENCKDLPGFKKIGKDSVHYKMHYKKEQISWKKKSKKIKYRL